MVTDAGSSGVYKKNTEYIIAAGKNGNSQRGRMLNTKIGPKVETVVIPYEA
jgi:hypothetical protein